MCTSLSRWRMDRIGSPSNKRSRGTRAALLDAAWRLLEQAGGEALTMAAIAESAGVSRRALYLHFASRGQLLMALLDHVDETLDLAASLRPLQQAPDAVTALDALAAHIAGYHSRLVAVARAIDRVRHDDPDAAALWDRSTGAWYRGCEAVAMALATEGHLAEPWTPATAADLMWALMSVELVDDLTMDRGWSTEQLAQRLRVVLRRTLLRPEP